MPRNSVAGACYVSALVTLACLLSAWQTSAFGQNPQERVALVIGNAEYERSPLRNPVNDARALAAKLESLGFKVIKRENLRSREVGSALREFRSRLSPGAVALFFYAGHGLQIRGANYLPTVDAQIVTEDDVPTQSLNLAQVLELMEESKTRVNLVFLDACRDNPYASKFRSASRGLAKIDAAAGTMISFATRPGSVAADGEGSNGLYTEHLLRHMDDVDLPIEQVLKRVGAAVKLSSAGRQEPWSEGLIEGEFYFRPAKAVSGAAPLSAAAPAAAPQPAEVAFWESVKGSRNPAELRAYLEQYPRGQFAVLAHARLAGLESPEKPQPPTRRGLGVISQNVTPELAAAFALPSPAGAMVFEVFPDGAAARAGIQAGDVITALNGEKVVDSNGLSDVTAKQKPGVEVKIQVWRSGKPSELPITIVSPPLDRRRFAPAITF